MGFLKESGLRLRIADGRSSRGQGRILVKRRELRGVGCGRGAKERGGHGGVEFGVDRTTYSDGEEMEGKWQQGR